MITTNFAKTLVTSVCSIHCNNSGLLTLKKREIERIFLQRILHALIIKVLARFARHMAQTSPRVPGSSHGMRNELAVSKQLAKEEKRGL